MSSAPSPTGGSTNSKSRACVTSIGRVVERHLLFVSGAPRMIGHSLRANESAQWMIRMSPHHPLPSWKVWKDIVWVRSWQEEWESWLVVREGEGEVGFERYYSSPRRERRELGGSSILVSAVLPRNCSSSAWWDRCFQISHSVWWIKDELPRAGRGEIKKKCRGETYEPRISWQIMSTKFSSCALNFSAESTFLLCTSSSLCSCSNLIGKLACWNL